MIVFNSLRVSGKFLAADCHPPIPLDPAITPEHLYPKQPNHNKPPHAPFPRMFSFELSYYANVKAQLSVAQAHALNNLLLAHFPKRRDEILSPAKGRELIMESDFALLGEKAVFHNEHGREYIPLVLSEPHVLC